jgi:hypothetical protein
VSRFERPATAGPESDQKPSADERRRVRLCRLVVYSVPLLVAAISLSVLRAVGPIRPATEWRIWATLAGNAVLATLIPAAFVAISHPAPARRWLRGIISAAICPLLYVVYVVAIVCLMTALQVRF